MLDLTSLIGTINNTIHEYTDATGITSVVIEWDIEYIVRSAVLLLSMWFFYKLILGFLHKAGGRQ